MSSRARSLAVAASLFVVVATPLGLGRSQAARDLVPVEAAMAGAELVVYESAASIYCQIFRRDIAPAYARSPRATRVPMRFVEVSSANLDGPELASPITSVPTVVLMRDGREEGRITGYVGPDNFHKMVSHLVGPLD